MVFFEELFSLILLYQILPDPKLLMSLIFQLSNFPLIIYAGLLLLLLFLNNPFSSFKLSIQPLFEPFIFNFDILQPLEILLIPQLLLLNLIIYNFLLVFLILLQLMMFFTYLGEQLSFFFLVHKVDLLLILFKLIELFHSFASMSILELFYISLMYHSFFIDFFLYELILLISILFKFLLNLTPFHNSLFVFHLFMLSFNLDRLADPQLILLDLLVSLFLLFIQFLPLHFLLLQIPFFLS